MNEWRPGKFSDDPIVNAILNVAAEINGHSEATRRAAHELSNFGTDEDGNGVTDALNNCAKAIDGILYGLKYGKSEGMSISESIEVVGRKISDAISILDLEEAADQIASIGFRDGESMIVEASKKIAEALESVASSIDDVADKMKDGSQ